jgi:hypothetical protein
MTMQPRGVNVCMVSVSAGQGGAHPSERPLSDEGKLYMCVCVCMCGYVVICACMMYVSRAISV